MLLHLSHCAITVLSINCKLIHYGLLGSKIEIVFYLRKHVQEGGNVLLQEEPYGK